MTINHSKPGKCITSTHNTTGVRGYYLVLPNRDRHWIGETIHEAARAIEKVCTKYLSDEIGWDYWIDYCHGYDVKNNLHWANVDKTDTVLHHAENM